MAYSAAVIGCGLIGAAHAFSSRAGIYSHTEAYSACPSTRLAAVCDLDAERAQAAGRRWSVPAITDPARLLADVQPTIVSICTPDASHAAMIRLALATPSVKAILAEKPLALELEDARALVEEARQKQVVLAVNYSRRHGLGHRQLAARIADGLIGDIVAFHGYYTKGTRHNGTHWFDWLHMLAGEVVAVQGFDRLQEAGPDPTLDARLTLACGAQGNLAALDHRLYSLFELELVGTTGRLAFTESGHRFRLEKVGDSPWYAGYRTLLPAEEGEAGLHDTLLHAVTDLVEALESGRPPACSGKDAVTALAVAEAIAISSRSGQPMPVDPA